MGRKAWPAQALAGAGRQHDGAPARGHPHQVAVLQAQAGQVGGRQVDGGQALVAVEPAQQAGAAHAVPLVAQAAGQQAEGVGIRASARAGRHVGKRARPSAVGKTPSA
jgi:hypothetical protein